MDCWQAEAVLATAACLLVEVLGLCLQIFYFLADFLDFFHVFFDLIVVLSNDPILYFKPIEQIIFDDTEFQVWLALQNLEHQKWTDNLIFLIFAFVLVLIIANNLQSFNQTLFAIRRRKISEVRKSLDPKISRSRRICALTGILPTNFHHRLLVIWFLTSGFDIRFWPSEFWPSEFWPSYFSDFWF